MDVSRYYQTGLNKGEPHMDVIYPLAVNPSAGAKMLGVSRSKFYELLSQGQLPLIKIGSRSLVRVADIEKLLASLATQGQR
jgi:excisionase family DNA binding protein